MLRRVKKKAGKKIHSNKGDSIAEVLIALLISALALVMLASMITTSSKLIISSKSKLEDYYNWKDPVSGDATVTFTFRFGDNSISEDYEVSYSGNTQLKEPVVSFHK